MQRLPIAIQRETIPVQGLPVAVQREVIPVQGLPIAVQREAIAVQGLPIAVSERQFLCSKRQFLCSKRQFPYSILKKGISFLYLLLTLPYRSHLFLIQREIIKKQALDK